MDFLNNLSGGEIIGLLAVIVGPLIAIVAIVSSQWRRVRVAEIEAALKQQMLDKGMSAAEIEQVLNAGHAVGPVDRATLAQQMVEQGYEGADIERVLKAYQPGEKIPANPL